MYTHISVQQDGLPAVAHAALRLKILSFNDKHWKYKKTKNNNKKKKTTTLKAKAHKQLCNCRGVSVSHAGCGEL